MSACALASSIREQPQGCFSDTMTIMENIYREFIYIWYYFDLQFRQIFAYWVIGMALGSFVSVFAKDQIHSLFAKMNGLKWGIFGIVPACLLGIASPYACMAPFPWLLLSPSKACGMIGLPLS